MRKVSITRNYMPNAEDKNMINDKTTVESKLKRTARFLLIALIAILCLLVLATRYLDFLDAKYPGVASWNPDMDAIKPQEMGDSVGIATYGKWYKPTFLFSLKQMFKDMTTKDRTAVKNIETSP